MLKTWLPFVCPFGQFFEPLIQQSFISLTVVRMVASTRPGLEASRR